MEPISYQGRRSSLRLVIMISQEDIIHMVIARTPEAQAGIHGISLFIVPKIIVNDDNMEITLGKLASIEH